MTQNGEELKHCVKNLKGVRGGKHAEIDNYIQFVQRHEKYGKLYHELVLALYSEKERIDQDIRQKELDKYIKKQSEYLTHANAERIKAERKAKEYTDAIKEMQSVASYTMKGQPGYEKRKLSEQKAHADRVSTAVHRSANHESMLRSAIDIPTEPSYVTTFKALDKAWDDSFPKGYNQEFSPSERLEELADQYSYNPNDLLLNDEVNNLSEYLSQKGDTYSPLGMMGGALLGFGDGMSSSAQWVTEVVPRLADGNFLNDIQVLKNFLAKKRTQEIQKLPSNERNELQLLLVEMKIGKYYERQIINMIGGLQDVSTFSDILRKRSDRVNYFYVVQNLEYHKSKVYHLINYMTAYVRKQMQYVRDYYDNTIALMNRAKSEYSDCVEIENIIHSFNETNIERNHLGLLMLPFRGVNAIVEHAGKMGHIDNMSQKDARNISFPHLFKVCVEEYNRLFEEIRNIVVANDHADGNKHDDYHITEAQFNRYKQLIVKLDGLFKDHMQYVCGDKPQDYKYGQVGTSGSSFSGEYLTSGTVSVNKVQDMINEKGFIWIMRTTVEQLNEFQANLVQKMTRCELDKGAGSYTGPQLFVIKRALENWANGLMDYYRLHLDFCVKEDTIRLTMNNYRTKIHRITQEAKKHQDKMESIEKRVIKDNVISKLYDIDRRITEMFKEKIPRGDEYKYKVTERYMMLRKLQAEKTALLDYLASICGEYDDTIADLAKSSQQVINTRHDYNMCLYQHYTGAVVGQVSTLEYINTMRHKFRGYFDHLKNSGYPEEQLRPIYEIIWNMEKIAERVTTMCYEKRGDLRSIVEQADMHLNNSASGSSFTLNDVGFASVAENMISCATDTDGQMRNDIYEACGQVNVDAVQKVKYVVNKLHDMKMKLRDVSHYLSENGGVTTMARTYELLDGVILRLDLEKPGHGLPNALGADARSNPVERATLINNWAQDLKDALISADADFVSLMALATRHSNKKDNMQIVESLKRYFNKVTHELNKEMAELTGYTAKVNSYLNNVYPLRQDRAIREPVDDEFHKERYVDRYTAVRVFMNELITQMDATNNASFAKTAKINFSKYNENLNREVEPFPVANGVRTNYNNVQTTTGGARKKRSKKSSKKRSKKVSKKRSKKASKKRSKK